MLTQEIYLIVIAYIERDFMYVCTYIKNANKIRY